MSLKLKINKIECDTGWRGAFSLALLTALMLGLANIQQFPSYFSLGIWGFGSGSKRHLLFCRAVPSPTSLGFLWNLMNSESKKPMTHIPPWTIWTAFSYPVIGNAIIVVIIVASISDTILIVIFLPRIGKVGAVILSNRQQNWINQKKNNNSTQKWLKLLSKYVPSCSGRLRSPHKSGLNWANHLDPCPRHRYGHCQHSRACTHSGTWDQQSVQGSYNGHFYCTHGFHQCRDCEECRSKGEDDQKSGWQQKSQLSARTSAFSPSCDWQRLPVF